MSGLIAAKGKNPAELSGEKVLQEIYHCIDKGLNFKLEAGAGAGKTFSLNKALEYIIEKRGKELTAKNQQVACITYTNVAVEQIDQQTDDHPVIMASTIHSFCWELINNFQPALKENLSKNKKWKKLLDENDDPFRRAVHYDLGNRRRIDDVYIHLIHDDVLELFVALMGKEKFRRFLQSKYPILLIDEYQDTNSDFADCLEKYFIATEKGPLIGLFGDSWQQIYRDTCGSIEHENFHSIEKHANFRSDANIVNALNNIRSELPQDPCDPDSAGLIRVYHTNDWEGDRRDNPHWWKGDLPEIDAHEFIEALIKQLKEEGWDFNPKASKILMLTHRVLAFEQDYPSLPAIFRRKENYINKEHPYIKFLVETVEPVCEAFDRGHYGNMFHVMNTRSARLNNHDDKLSWISDLNKLIDIRHKGSINDVLEHLKTSARPEIPDAVMDPEKEIENLAEEKIEDNRKFKEIRSLKEVPYKEIIALTAYINDHTPFSTKHGVKGDEFENVLVVLGRGWNLYNWNQFLEWFPDKAPEEKEKTYERNRNLFYVACSRAKHRLILLITQELSGDALSTLENIFGGDNIHSFNPKEA